MYICMDDLLRFLYPCSQKQMKYIYIKSPFPCSQKQFQSTFCIDIKYYWSSVFYLFFCFKAQPDAKKRVKMTQLSYITGLPLTTFCCTDTQKLNLCLLVKQYVLFEVSFLRFLSSVTSHVSYASYYIFFQVLGVMFRNRFCAFIFSNTFCCSDVLCISS